MASDSQTLFKGTHHVLCVSAFITSARECQLGSNSLHRRRSRTRRRLSARAASTPNRGADPAFGTSQLGMRRAARCRESETQDLVVLGWARCAIADPHPQY